MLHWKIWFRGLKKLPAALLIFFVKQWENEIEKGNVHYLGLIWHKNGLITLDYQEVQVNDDTYVDNAIK